MSLRFKLAAVMSAICLVAIFAVGGVRTVLRFQELDEDLARKAAVYAELLAIQLEPAVAYDDVLTAREVLESAATDSDVTQVALYAEDGTLIQGSAEPPPPWEKTPAAVMTRIVADGMVGAAPIVPKEGPRGVLYLHLSSERMHHQMHRVLVVSALITLGLLAVAVLAAWSAAGLVIKRLARIASRADRIANGELALEALEPGSLDEVGRLTVGFNVMLERIRTEQERLAELVDARTAELSASREQFRQIVEKTRAIPFEYDLSREQFTYVGPQATDVSGHSVAEWQAPGFFRQGTAAAEYERWAVEMTKQDTEVRFKAKAGRAVHLRCSAYVNGAVARGLMVDVTERKALEEELQQAQRLESVGRLAAGVAHEINTPVQYANDSVTFVRDAIADLVGLVDAYRTAGQVLEDHEQRIDLDYLRDNAPKSADRAIEGLSRIADIVKSMKAFSQSDQHEMTSVDVREGLQTTLIIAKNEYKYVADVETTLAEVPSVTARPGELNQVWLSILTNAAMAIGERGSDRGKIVVRAEAEAGSVVISISDTGCGIPKEVQPRIFEQFFTTRAVGKGKGQSLASARAIVRRHGGEIWFDSVAGEGTTFFVALPAEGAAPLRLVA